MADRIELNAGDWTAEINSFGAELSRLHHQSHGDLLWPAAEPWRRHAPNLFPIVGKLAGGRLRHQGRDYDLGQHGFARDREFGIAARAWDAAVFRLSDDEDTRRHYPFPFILDIGYRLTAAGLDITYDVINPTPGPLPFSIGAHPAFRWPLDRAAAKTAHWLEFDAPEPAPIRRLAEGLLAPEPQPSPVRGRRLDLDDSLFAADAVIMDRLASRGLVFAGPGLGLRIAWTGFSELGLWMKPGADYLCIEPWAGFADPLGFAGEFSEKPGLRHADDEGRCRFTLSVALA
ncbi:aldose 1-epimerase family protein [Zavarzinia compransoris]|uniref:Aldose epimerase n=1 Tax=Zavarzinia compransoris TaxID=1264899 RepID=A0A317DVN6_9PROT|nr:aldose 1-epimerase family protein [Zavarzinia compransoris]PWR18748.1 aldose epimerase [Zavarzinia compransoris]TDP48731.1 galactose mutarotase-like enzyme [Zavarzinia compransoris]